MNGLEVIAIVAMTCGLLGFLGYLGFLAHTNNSKNLKNDYLVIESQSDYRMCKKEECCETNCMSDKKENNRTVKKVVRINGIGKDIKSNEGR